MPFYKKLCQGLAVVNKDYEISMIPCVFCGVPIETHWCSEGGGMLRGEDHSLLASWVVHNTCLDESLKDYKPSD